MCIKVGDWEEDKNRKTETVYQKRKPRRGYCQMNNEKQIFVKEKRLS